MPDITITWTVTDAEYARLTALAGEESVDSYVDRMGLKALRGHLQDQAVAARARALATLSAAYDNASPQAKLAALEALGYEVDQATGEVVPKGQDS